MTNPRKRFYQIANIVSLVFALAANFIVAAQLIDVPAINQVSDRYATVLTPATYAFSIWSLIYTLLVVFVIYQARDLRKPDAANDLPQRTGPYFIIASILNGLWTYLFVKDYVGISVIVLLTLTASLYILLKRLDIAVAPASRWIKLCVWWPLMLYTGWVTAASIVNIASWLQSLGVYLPPVSASLILIALAAVLLILLRKRRVGGVLLAAGWGIAAVGVRQLHTGESRLVMITAFVVSGVFMIAVITQSLRPLKDSK